MKPLYYKYPNSDYIVLSDGTVARSLKETIIGKQTYLNLILDGKMKRVNKEKLIAPFAESADEGLHT